MSVTFSYHLRNHWTALIGVLGFLVVAETLGLHVALVARHPLVAWTLAATNLAALAWMVADWRAIRSRPMLVEADRLTLHRGLRKPIVIDRAGIVDVSLGEASFQVPADLGVFSVGRPNVIITLLAARRVGRKQVTRLAVFVDEPEAFVAAARPAGTPARKAESIL